ncbi:MULTISPECIES: DUF4870 domain-containing protein [Thermoactinomyces]|jgi:uncharacterized protein|uniref:DUF4870 domain-containing protein n=1 Tax=Thermoactinomyces daqus TaxID=1329516 RepID=A0A7W1X7Z0_9BACL|nr:MULTISPECIES: DUF4870 domain-containing protein [Thermoactinomyces]MBA4541706.1 DUF4870 domain-containing protein [Thermoactinomyces daqus]MBH8597209.1 DUF4870 domain-containing protein [Thermoactinomyces sp. CICC 10523]MBH8602769.1 DUF4870 domain-containing protein [Thermoactinomyces sp. CICC 10522]MBH8606122.1 DUF4870 domain-containing protein [Thermoactinomyces sp. CICC 10521]
MVTTEDKIFAVLCHASLFFFPFLLPVILMMAKKNSPFVQHHAKEAFAFHLFSLVAVAVSAVLTLVLIGFLLIPLISLFAFCATIMAVIRTIGGQLYHYPVTSGIVHRH